MKMTHCPDSYTSRHAVPNPGFSRFLNPIGILVFDGFSMLPVAEVVDVFDKANHVLAAAHRDTPTYRTAFVSRHGGCISSSAHIDVLTQSIKLLGKARALFVASGETGDTQSDGWLREATVESDEIFPIGNGDALLSAMGGSSRWSTAGNQTPTRDLRAMDTGSVTAPHAPMPRSGIRQALEIIRRDFGVAILRRVLELLPDTNRPELALIASDNGKSIRQKIQESAQWITRNCNKSISITVAAQTANMSDRSYLRHFRAEMGVNPSEHLRRSRIELAAAMLESSDLPVDKIARRCGLTGGECLARLFRQVWHISPTEYRSRLRSTCSKT
ncbi:helix-turn-helix domain-containing protein [Paraburkholderia sp. CNPSo 3157]|uniref:Helix-turn-helix domain-containing protein n=1 Tax=Paraburkholderia franconis TaxID=2654983 RepID=A0A7X1NF71_9BURK|nr:helix-turn-helix domain-containing protein [Paraburkholderia franconis]MPW20857.1 helix-turn-helix domain-containing protein [Paraburkholderia franconis]